jgi:hypothetical protein
VTLGYRSRTRRPPPKAIAPASGSNLSSSAADYEAARSADRSET